MAVYTFYIRILQTFVFLSWYVTLVRYVNFRPAGRPCALGAVGAPVAVRARTVVLAARNGVCVACVDAGAYGGYCV